MLKNKGYSQSLKRKLKRKTEIRSMINRTFTKCPVPNTIHCKGPSSPGPAHCRLTLSEFRGQQPKVTFFPDSLFAQGTIAHTITEAETI